MDDMPQLLGNFIRRRVVCRQSCAQPLLSSAHLNAK